MAPISTSILLFLVIVIQAPLTVQSRRFRFRNIAKNPNKSGLHYRRTPSHTFSSYQKILQNSVDRALDPNQLFLLPQISHGQPGVAIGDFNQDGVDDIYITNGPNTPNSLFINQYPLTGRVTFVDEAIERGVHATEQDSTGVCYGDLTGNGRQDLIVLSEFNRNKIFISLANGRYRELDWVATTGDPKWHTSTSCSIGDVDNDGLLDIVVANSMNRDTFLGCNTLFNPPNQLFINKGPSDTLPVTFKETTEESGINNFSPDVPTGANTPTWAAALVDVNLDGNLDIVIANDQCGLPPLGANPPGANRGFINVQWGDGNGNFVNMPLRPVDPEKNNRAFGGLEIWMGLGFGDFNCDGHIDIFGSNTGDYVAEDTARRIGAPPTDVVGLRSSRWFLGSAEGTFTDASVEETGATLFGWGVAVCDYDNDGDQDIFMVGGLEIFTAASTENPNIIYKNHGCAANFSYDLESWEPSGSLNGYQGLAIGDFNMDGYPDIVGAASYSTTPTQRTTPVQFGSALDRTAFFTTIVNQTGQWSGNVIEGGPLMVEINRETDRSKCRTSILPVGMRGRIPSGRVNRGALGATILVTPDDMPTVMTPVIGGESFGSQHSPRRNFGLGPNCEGTVEILWPPQVRNRLYDVKHAELLTLPEIPCSFDGGFGSEDDYISCVRMALRSMVAKQIVSQEFAERLHHSAVFAREQFLSGSM